MVEVFFAGFSVGWVHVVLDILYIRSNVTVQACISPRPVSRDRLISHAATMNPLPAIEPREFSLTRESSQSVVIVIAVVVVIIS